MTTPAAETGGSEITGLASAQTYAAAMAQAYARTATGTEAFAAGLSGHGVNGPAVAAATRALDLTMQAGAAWSAASAALDRQTTVKEAYAVAPEAGDKQFLTDGQAQTIQPAPTGPPAAIKDPLRVGDKFVLPDGASFAGSGSAKDDDGFLLLAAAVDTPDGRVVHVGVPIHTEDKAHWKGAHAPTQETHLDPDSEPDDADEDRFSTVDTGADVTVVLDADAAAQLPAQVDAIITEAIEADKQYRQYAKRCDKLYDERSNLEAKRFADPADAELQMRLDGRESQNVKLQKKRRAEMDEAVDRLSPADRARYDDLQRRIEEAGADRFDPEKAEQAAAVCGVPVDDYRDLVELQKTPWYERSPEQRARADELDSDRLPSLLAQQAAVVRGLSLEEYRLLEVLDKVGRPHHGFGGRPGGRTAQQQARFEELCTAPGGATGATPRETAKLRDGFETYQGAHHSAKLSWTAEREQRAALAERARPLEPADAARLQKVIAEHDELSDLCETLGGEVIASVEVPGRTGTTLLVEAVQREEEGGVDYRVDCTPASSDTYRTTAGGLRKAIKVIAALADRAGGNRG